jgi:hypothetical protein
MHNDSRPSVKERRNASDLPYLVTVHRSNAEQISDSGEELQVLHGGTNPFTPPPSAINDNYQEEVVHVRNPFESNVSEPQDSPLQTSQQSTNPFDMSAPQENKENLSPKADRSTNPFDIESPISAPGIQSNAVQRAQSNVDRRRLAKKRNSWITNSANRLSLNSLSHHNSVPDVPKEGGNEQPKTPKTQRFNPFKRYLSRSGNTEGETE